MDTPEFPDNDETAIIDLMDESIDLDDDGEMPDPDFDRWVPRDDPVEDLIDHADFDED